MFDFMQLAANENMKIYRRPRTWIMLGLLLLLAGGSSVLGYAFSDMKPSMWEIMSFQSMLLFPLVTIFTVVISADSVAGEFSSGTIKLLLIRPWSRSKILLSKYAALLLFALLFSASLFLFTVVANGALFGFDGDYRFDVRPDMPPFAYMLLTYISMFAGLIVIVTLSFMISTVFRSGGLAIGLSIFILLGGSLVTGILSVFDYEWIKYLLFFHTDLTQHLNKRPMLEGMTLGFSLAVLAGYYIVFVALTWFVFNKRDVAA
ncbi:MAG TPA: DUF2705 family protein [Paenibacillus sp.]|uniref:ABC transporter permease n=1 Tax=Paenibacillus sp. TaxID=58172 RepID=UPI002C97FE58|nr:DUF2705 family protein [Paenibacillus sp.]HUC92629.1 DUF2705 family protein [Paenibacillus sp.]